MIVVDAGAATDAFVNPGARGDRARAALARDPYWLVPDHWATEVFSAIRGLSAGGKITDEAAETGLRLAAASTVERFRVSDLFTAMWALRHNFSAYDAPYVVIAAARDLTLVSGDGRLARAAVSHCRVELV